MVFMTSRAQVIEEVVQLDLLWKIKEERALKLQ